MASYRSNSLYRNRGSRAIRNVAALASSGRVRMGMHGSYFSDARLRRRLTSGSGPEGGGMKFSRVWAMPSPWTFTIPPIAAFLSRHGVGNGLWVDPFAGQNSPAAIRNDLRPDSVAEYHLPASVAAQIEGPFDGMLFDPPYSPRQIAECYSSAGLKCGVEETQSGRLYRLVRENLGHKIKTGGKVLSFGWSTVGMGDGWEIKEIMLVCHGGAHNDTICMAEEKKQGELLWPSRRSTRETTR